MAERGMFAPLAGAGKSSGRRRRGEWRALFRVPVDAQSAPQQHPTLGAPSSVYTYRTSDGELAGYVCRFEPKEFRPLTYCEHSTSKERSWRWKGFPLQRPLYNRDRLAARPDATVVVCEGEKAADAAGRLLPDFVATTSPGGSNGAVKADWLPLHKRRVVVWRDADGAGQTYAETVARCLKQVLAGVVGVAPPPDVKTGWDAADAETEGWDEARALALVKAAAPIADIVHGRRGAAGGTDADGSAGDGDGQERGSAQRDLIVGAAGEAELWHDRDLTAYATIPVNGHLENWPVRSRRFKTWLTGRYYEHTRHAPGGQSLQEALGVLEYMGIEKGPCHDVWRRVAEQDGKIYHDLCNADWRAVEIDADGWRVVDRPPVKFIRSAAMRALPAPESGELIESLRGFLNVATDADFEVIVGWLVGALRPKGPFPVLILNGEQGSAKSTTARVLRDLTDPNAAPIRAAPRDERDLSVAADNNWMIVLDNLSGLSGWLSDALCRIATGGGFATRELHTNREEIVLTAVRPILLNGITALDTRADLGDRGLVVVLPPIGRENRQTEAEFWAAFETARPAILGAIYDAVSCALRRSGKRRVMRRLRMADFAEWIEAAAPALGWTEGAFVEAYAENQATAVHNVIEDNPVARAVRQLVEDRGEWEGSASELLPLLDAKTLDNTRKHRSWPKTPAILGAALKRLMPALRTVGVNIMYDRVGHDRQRTWTIRYQAKE